MKATTPSEAISEHASYLAVERGLRPNTLLAYKRDLDAYLDFLRRHKIDDINAVDESLVNEYLSIRLSHISQDGESPAPATVARALVSVRSLHRFCVDEELAQSDPTDSLQAPRVPMGIPKALSESEVVTLLDAVTGQSPRNLRDRAILETLYGSGCRISELVGIDRSDIDLEAGLVRVFGKGAKERVVPIGQLARDAISQYLSNGRSELEGIRGDKEAVFLNARGGRLTRQGCWGIVRDGAQRSGLNARIYPHVLRHSCATHLLDHGADIRVVQELLGHASISTTQIYTKVSPERLRGAYDAAHPRSRVVR